MAANPKMATVLMTFDPGNSSAYAEGQVIFHNGAFYTVLKDNPSGTPDASADFKAAQVAVDTSKFVTTNTDQTIGSASPATGKKTFAGGASMSGRTLENVGTPSIEGDAANKKYVDGRTEDPDYKVNSYQDTGRRWIDGKKIWRTTFQGTSHKDSGQTVTLGNLSNMETPIEIHGFTRVLDGNRLPVNYYFYDNGYNTTCIIANNNDIQYTWRSTSANTGNLSARVVWVTVYYTRNDM